LRPNAELSEIVGDDVVSGVHLRDTRSGAVSELDAAGVFVFVGLVPNSGLVSNLLNLEENGRIVTDPELRTSQPGVFAAGTVRAGAAGRAAAAAGDGTLSAIAAARFLAR
jgi:thioredoxin reductase (NADPH)